MTIHRATIHRSAAHWPKEETADTVTLEFDARHRRRIRLTTDRGDDVLLSLPKAVAMADGDGLQLEDGRWLAVRAAAEPIIEVRHVEPDQLVRLAWHIGNRHLAIEVRNKVLCIRPDHVIEEILRSHGATLVKLQAPFQPEGGAYSGHSDDHAEHHHA